MIEDETKASKEVAEAKKERAAADKGTASMHIKVYSPYRVYFDEDSLSISAENATGPFDILPHHHNFLTLLNACELVIHPITGTKEQKIRISGGLMHVKADQVTVFLDI
ncbi:MAG TPA: F0F1 ATP synthase subunit epsilon [Candidatus Saccharimonadales bacterium]|nr:F0F1 ATP synthase subunit epsilon [Candidatus Saccharimonadales bacterium]